MKKRPLLLVICMCAVIALLSGLFSCGVVYADDQDHPVLGYVIPKGLFDDGKLYVAVSSVYGNSTMGTEFYNDGKVYQDMFKAAGIKKLDLSGTWGISSMKGLEYLDLSEIEILDLSFNNLSGEIDLTAFTSLKRVNLANNSITGVKITGLIHLEEIILNNNEISSINLEDFAGNKVDLSNNKISSISSITLPTKAGVNIDLINNNITDVVDTVTSGAILNLGLQADKNDSSKVVIYRPQDANIKVVIKGDGFEKSSTELSGQSEVVTLLPGNYTVEYRYVSDDSKVWNSDEIYTIDTVWKAGYVDKTISTKPASPTYSIYVNGQQQSSTTITDEGELKIDTLENVKTYISYDNESWKEYDGSSIKLEKNSLRLYVKNVQNDIDSDVVTISINYEKSAISPWLTIIFLLLFVAGFIGACWLAKKYWIDRSPSTQE